MVVGFIDESSRETSWFTRKLEAKWSRQCFHVLVPWLSGGAIDRTHTVMAAPKAELSRAPRSAPGSDTKLLVSCVGLQTLSANCQVLRDPRDPLDWGPWHVLRLNIFIVC